MRTTLPNVRPFATASTPRPSAAGRDGRSLGVTVMMTLEIEDAYSELRLGPRENSFLTDAIILQRYVEMEGQLKRLIAVVKVRASQHSKDIRLYDVTSTGLDVSATRVRHRALLVGRAMALEPDA